MVSTVEPCAASTDAPFPTPGRQRIPSISQEFGHEELDIPMFRAIEVGQSDRKKEEFRVYTEEAMDGLVMATYKTINSEQTVEFVREQREKWGQLNHARMTISEALKLLSSFVDESDPDTSAAQRIHGFQTAERCRELFPEHEFMALIGLIHDLGKTLAIWDQPQWATVGDTWPVGAAMAEKHTFSKFYRLNPDANNSVFNSKYGMYEPHCGLDNLLMSYGHDEYLYQVLVGNGCPIPPEGLHIIRYHSFYSHHQHNAYAHFCNQKDEQIREWLVKFQIADLYSKSDDRIPEIDTLLPYYQDLIDKYCPGVLCW